MVPPDHTSLALTVLLDEHRVEALSQIKWVVGAGFLASAVAVLITRGRVAGMLSRGHFLWFGFYLVPLGIAKVLWDVGGPTR
jgi:undecaprenyl pyrophosphate phosphatase UppP